MGVSRRQARTRRVSRGGAGARARGRTRHPCPGRRQRDHRPAVLPAQAPAARRPPRRRLGGLAARARAAGDGLGPDGQAVALHHAAGRPAGGGGIAAAGPLPGDPGARGRRCRLAGRAGRGARRRYPPCPAARARHRWRTLEASGGRRGPALPQGEGRGAGQRRPRAGRRDGRRRAHDGGRPDGGPAAPAAGGPAAGRILPRARRTPARAGDRLRFRRAGRGRADPEPPRRGRDRLDPLRRAARTRIDADLRDRRARAGRPRRGAPGCHGLMRRGRRPAPGSAGPVRRHGRRVLRSGRR